MRWALELAVVLSISLVAFDAALDGGICTASGAETTSCHACACGPRIATDRTSVIAPRAVPRLFSPYQQTVHLAILPKSFFHPPKSSA